MSFTSRKNMAEIIIILHPGRLFCHCKERYTMLYFLYKGKAAGKPAAYLLYLVNHHWFGLSVELPLLHTEKLL